MLLVDGRPVASAEVASTFAERSRGLLGRTGVDGAVWFERTSSVHTMRMRFAIDVAFCDRTGRVLAVRRMRPWRLSRLRPRARVVVEAEAGAFDRWGVRRGAQLGLGSTVGVDERLPAS